MKMIFNSLFNRPTILYQVIKKEMLKTFLMMMTASLEGILPVTPVAF